MTYLFDPVNRRKLRHFACSNVLLAFDYDGTLAPIVSVPSRGSMRESTRQLLRRISIVYPCVIISGRARADVARRVNAAGIGRVIGNHGAEPYADNPVIRRRVRRWLPALCAQLGSEPGVVIEDKRCSLAIHYRNAPRPAAARRAILVATRSLSDVRILGGKSTFNLVVPDAPDKGMALERERTRLACDTAIYVGDDVTDEDVFRRRRSALLSIRVGRARQSAASHYLRGQREIDRLLRRLIELRPE